MKTALIWGAGGGIGQAVTAELAQSGWQVAALGRHLERVSETAFLTVEADVASDHAVRQAAMAVGMEMDTADLYLYCAGDITAQSAADMDLRQWQRILNANLTGAFLTAHHSLPLLAPDAGLIFLGAVSERLRLPKLSAYAAAKAGLEAFVEALRKEERRRQVILVRPAAVATPLWNKVPMKQPGNAPSPEKVAQRILRAYHEGHTGQLDLVL
jgi:NAD(P)-dependent dehydrogenase (short-subunit alcohol dehydrogenase family)